MANISFDNKPIEIPCDYATREELDLKQDLLVPGKGVDIQGDEIYMDYVIRGGGTGAQTLAAGARKAFTIENVAPNGYVIAAYRQISIAAGDGTTNWQKCFIQFFSTTGSGKNAQVAIVNSGTASASITINVNCLCIKE